MTGGELLQVVPAVAMLAAVAFASVRRPALAIATLFVLFQLVWRLPSLVYIEWGEPVFAEELERSIGGVFGASTWFVVSYVLVLAPVVVALRPAASRAWRAMPAVGSARGMTLGDVVLAAAGVFVALLYVDMLSRGVIPLLEGMERFEYTRSYAGPLHHWLFEYGNVSCLVLGMFCVHPRLRGEDYDARFIVLLGALFGYCVLTGHRFSAFYSFGSFFVTPFAAAALAHAADVLSPLPAPRRGWRRWILSGRAIAALVGVAALVVAFALINSYVNVRSFSGEELAFKISQRLLVQQSQLWWVTWERLMVLGQWSPGEALEFVQRAPIDPARNTGMQYLMVAAVGIDRASEILAQGSQYAGGFPEALFEVFGPVQVLPVLLVLGVCYAALLRLVLECTARGWFVTGFLAAYVIYGVLLVLASGMVNALLAPTYWIKVAALVVALLLESTLARRGLALLPWRLCAPRPPIAGDTART